MTPERLLRMEDTLAETVAVLQTASQSHVAMQETLKTLIASQTRTNEAIAAVAELAGQCTAAANVRMSRIEENLDGLIRAITAEHSNGKS